MKTHITKSVRQAGIVLVITLMLCVILGTTMATYLIMASNQSLSVYRSQNWNYTMVVTEAGIEDGLQLLNKYPGTFDSLTNWESDYASDNWSSPAANVYYVHRNIGNNYYDVYITNYAGGADVYSQGTCPWNYTVASAPTTPQAMFAATTVSVSGADLKRGVVVRTKVDSLINVAMAALQTIDFKGNNIATDSFDSADPLYSTNGLYPAGIPSMTKANGDVVTDDTIIDSLAIGNADIKGHVKTGPKGTITIGPNGSVGDRAWVEGGNSGIEPGYSSDDMNVLFPDVALPNTSWLSWSKTSGNSPNSKVNGVSYDYIINQSGDFTINGDVNGGQGGIYIASNCIVRLKITGSIALSGQSQIHIASGAKLQIYMAASSFNLSGLGLVNENGNAGSFYYFGLPANTSLTMGGNANFVGVIYAPEAAFTLGGGGSNTYDFIGASVTKTVSMNGKFNFHYDENLRRNNMGRGYIPTNWHES